MMDIVKFLYEHCAHELARDSFFFEHICDFYGSNVPQKYIDQYNSCSIGAYEYLDENLQTHDYKKLQEKLYKEYEKDIYIFVNLDYKDTGKDQKSFWIELNDNKDNCLKLEFIENKKPELFFNILDFFNYTLSEQREIDSRQSYLIEPIYSNKINDIFFNKYHRQAYHFTLKGNIQSILKNGLRIKQQEYRKFPSRLYLYMGYENLNKMNQKELYDFLIKIFDKKDPEIIGVVRIDLTRLDFPIYRDSTMSFERSAFIYNSVPPKFIKKINFNVKELYEKYK